MLSAQKIHERSSKAVNAGKSSTFFLPVIQKKLSVGSAHDSYEAEADWVADQVMKMSESSSHINHTGSLVQRKCTSYEEEGKLQKKPLAESITSLIQCKSTENGGIAPSHVENHINSNKGRGSLMDNGTKSFMESRFGADFSDVRIHTGSDAVQMSRELSAQAFTVGNDIYFNEGKYAPYADAGKHLLAHELTHTVQQNAGVGRKIQKFDSPEHVALGNAGGQRGDHYITLLLHTRDIPNRTSPVSQWREDLRNLYNAGTEQQKRFMRSGLTYGEIVALSGDFYETTDQLYRASLREIYALLPLISGHATTQQLQSATGGRYMTLAERNDSHFSITAAGRPNNMQTWKQRHIQAITAAVSGNLDMANMINATADHYLTDRFASGHLLTERTDLDSVGGLFALLRHDIDNQYGLNVTNLRGDSWVAYGDEMWDSPLNANNRRFALEAVQASVRDIDIYHLYRSTGTLPNRDTVFEAERIIPQISLSSRRVEHTYTLLSSALNQRVNTYLNGAIQDINAHIESGFRTISNITNRIGGAISLVILDARNTCDVGNWTYHNMPTRGRAHLNVICSALSSIALNGNINNLLINLSTPLSGFNVDPILIELAEDITTSLAARGAGIHISPVEIRSLSVVRLVELLNLSGVITYNRPPHDLSIEQLRQLP